MMRFSRVPEPENFDRKVRRPGNKWLAEHPDAKRSEDYWTPFREILAEGFKNLCAFSVMWDMCGAVDHFIPFNSE